MILGFSTQINGKPTFFVEKIIQHLNPNALMNNNAGQLFYPKKHTIRVDAKKRWRVGMTIQFATGVRTSKYVQFAQGVCSKIEDFSITYGQDLITVVVGSEIYFHDINNAQGLPNRTEPKLEELAINDGFNNFEEFLKYFKKNFTGRIIHF